MPMVLRSRKSIYRNDEGDDGIQRRSIRASIGLTFREDTDESSSESELSEVMESDESAPPHTEEEEVADGTSAMGLKPCSVVLDQLRLKGDFAKRELEEKEEMSRKNEKQPASRIPTFQSALTKKRPSGSSHTTELTPAPSLTKKDALSSMTQLPDREVSGTGEPSKAKVASVRETALPLPTVRMPKLGLEISPVCHSEGDAFTSSPKSSVASEEHISMTIEPRPPLRAQACDDSSEEEEEAEGTSDNDDSPVALESRPHQTLQEDTSDVSETGEEKGDLPAACEDDETARSEGLIVEDETDSFLVKAIEDEEPPWEMSEPPVDLDESVSQSQEEDDMSAEDSTFEGNLKLEPKGFDCDMDASSGVAAKEFETIQERCPDTDTSLLQQQSMKKSAFSSFALFWLLPTTLLLLGGFGQHLWQYGLPKSVAHLMVQMETHWLDGFGLAQEPCSSDCRVQLLESIPQGLYESGATTFPSIGDGWLSLLGKAHSSVDIAAFYLTLRGSDLGLTDPSDLQGQKVFKQLMGLSAKGVKLQVAVNAPQTSPQDSVELASAGAEIREVDLSSLTGGIVHTKLLVVDRKHLYLGSANMDWRSLSQVKEVGIMLEDCSCLAQDASRIFGVYWDIGSERNGSLPPYWPARLSALSSAQHPLHLRLNGVLADVYLSSAPPQIAARGRSDDLSTILSIISDAQKFIHISVMDYLPTSQFTEPLRYWPDVDSALRGAACTRGVEVQLLISCWQHSQASMFVFLQSLAVLSQPPLGCRISVKVFTVPSTPEQEKIPFARVNHAKYMVTDRVVYIGTSNWSENYFTQTAGVGLVVNQTGSPVGPGQQTLQSQVEELFHRDWTSKYSRALPDNAAEACSHHHKH